ncbi:MAG TPA: class I SAM-dependent methyltransferase [Gaiellaceae bacterium]
MNVEDVLGEQRRYYAARAPEYDDWWFRRGRYELDEDTLVRWNADVEEVESALAAFDPVGAVVELAAGTGLWTRRLAVTASRLVAVDASGETLAVNRARLGDVPVEYVVADLFDWDPADTFDLCFFGFWISHVPEERFDAFWSFVRRLVVPGGRIFFLDGARDPAQLEREASPLERRQLADGREFRIVKRYWDPDELATLVAPYGFDLELRVTANGQFLYGGGS